MSIKKFGYNIHSQNNEDGLIEECLKRIKPTLKTSVEFGGADGYFCSNTALLRAIGWEVHMYDLKEVPGLVTERKITPENVNELPECSVLSIDVDGTDYEIWKAYKGEPDIVIIEINSSLPPFEEYISTDKGSSFGSMNALANEKGYFLLCHTGNNVYLLNKYLPLFLDRDIKFDTSWL